MRRSSACSIFCVCFLFFLLVLISEPILAEMMSFSYQLEILFFQVSSTFYIWRVKVLFYGLHSLKECVLLDGRII